MGYYLVFIGLEFRNDRRMMQRLDAEKYDSSQTVTIKIPIAVPYMYDNVDYIRVDGKFEHEGVIYRLVKQKYQGDTLNIVCIKDPEQKVIQDALSNYLKSFTDSPGDQHGSNGKHVLAAFIKDYISTKISINQICTGWQSEIFHSYSVHLLVPSYCASIIHPPERV